MDMYEQFFGLKEPPFSLTPDPDFVYHHSGHQAVINELLSGLQAGEGFLAVIAEVGSGKTLLCRNLLTLLPEDWASAYLPSPLLTPLELYRSIACELEIKVSETASLQDLQQNIFEKLAEIYRCGGQTVILIDEAQVMSLQSLEALRLLSNLETEKTKLLQVVFFAQPEFAKRLAQPSLRQLRQRITFVCHLEPIPASELAGYLNHRMAVAGHKGPVIFSSAAVRRIFKKSSGSPRLVNILAHKALLAAYGKGVHQVASRQVMAAVNDTFAWSYRPWQRSFWVGLCSSLGMTLVLIILYKGIL